MREAAAALLASVLRGQLGTANDIGIVFDVRQLRQRFVQLAKSPTDESSDGARSHHAGVHGLAAMMQAEPYNTYVDVLVD